MTNAPAPSVELAALLVRTDAALARGDTDAAAVDMSAAADLVRRLQAAGLGIPAGELDALREIADRCAVALGRLGEELNAECFRDDNHRRGISTYNGDRR